VKLKKIILILVGISLVLTATIYILYKNSESKKEEVVDIFKEQEEEKKEEIPVQDIEKEEEKNDTNIKKVVVDIKGMIANPGVYEVEETLRVNDVITIAGGLLEGADTSLINLAKIVEDEMIIIVYSSEQVKEKYKEEICVCDCPLIENDACINNEKEESEEENSIVNINTATIEELMKINGIGESKAQSIISYREEHGPFKNIEEIKNVEGIGEALFEKIKEYIKI